MTHSEAMDLARAKRAEAQAVRGVAARCSPAGRRAREALAAVLDAEAARLESGWIRARGGGCGHAAHRHGDGVMSDEIEP